MALASDDGVIKAQVAATMQSLLMGVQDKVMTDTGVLEQQELKSANWEAGADSNDMDTTTTQPVKREAEIVEQPVWGMDCYTRRNVSICLETEFDGDTVHTFVEKWLLPAINACPVDLAYNLTNAALILEGLPFDSSLSLDQDDGTTMEDWKSTLLGKALLKKMNESSPPWLRSAAHIFRRAIASMGYDFFRVHPKGHGSIVLCPKIPPNRLVTFYRGEVYPSWRWGEKMDAISLIQEKKGLKPRLPDFYNMTLERPQRDPRGYGLLFVDASRKSGYGSMLSHSCNPSCEVKVVAINGELTLAMTTLREMTIGEEVTFDYNAATDSLHEYQAAVCLCGNVNCRGSFLHFTTADCYQQVLNRNSPVAVRFSQLIKGCTKQVMAQDDSKILERHGFQTAAFGAVSVNRRKVTNGDFSGTELDSMEYVPIWLRTFVADTLRYIEYERRALPISLICNEITEDSKPKKKEEGSKPKKREEASKRDSDAPKKTSKKPQQAVAPKSVDDKPIKGHRPTSSFFFFSNRRREHFVSEFMKTGNKECLTGRAFESALKKVASEEWKTLTQDVKDHWKEQSIDDWKKNGGEEKARLEAERVKRLQQKSDSGAVSVTKKATAKKEDKKATAKKEELQDKFEENDSETSRISFQAADAEGISAMEQRIQQLTHSLSRVGRILDRHRERIGSSDMEQDDSPKALQKLTHSPLSIMPDEDVVAWMWNHPDGIVKTLLRMAKDDVCVSPDLLKSLELTEAKFSVLSDFGTPWECSSVDVDPALKGGKGRKLLNDALLELRSRLFEGIESMASAIKDRKASTKEKLKRKKDQSKKVASTTLDASQPRVRSAVKFILSEMLDTVAGRSTPASCGGDAHAKAEPENSPITEPWLLNYNKRFKLEKAADLLLMYARTSTFFRIVPYEPLRSSAIEVYAREIGNSVPRSAMDSKPSGASPLVPDEYAKENSMELCENDDDASVSSSRSGDQMEMQSAKKHSGVCDPEEIVSEVAVDYQGDYVLSQLLQWFNSGFDQKAGLPDILGCCLLPSLSGCFIIDTTKGSNSSTDKRTSYRERTRPRLVEWLKDPYKRGSPWPNDVRRVFVDKDQDKNINDASKCWLPIGSPVLDLLVTGDDLNVMEVLSHLGSDAMDTEDDNGGLLSTIDHGRPAQAVSNWVQCENENCQKWRKIPWNVDVDLISQRFVCSDNKWNPNSASCDAPEDDWDEDNDACVEADGSVKPREADKELAEECDVESRPDRTESIKFADFRIGVGKKKKWTAATVVDVDFVGQTRRVKFHFPRTQLKNDIWLDASSNSIATLYSKASPPEARKPSGAGAKKSKKTETSSTVKTVDIDSTSESSSAVARSESGTEDGDNENDIGDAGVVEDYQELGDADTDESESELVLVDSDDDQKQSRAAADDDADEDDDDGLNDDIGDDSESDSEIELNSDAKKTKDAFVPAVTDHSSPDSEHQSEALGGSSKSFTIPKKRTSPKGKPANVIPRKKLPEQAPMQHASVTENRGNSYISKRASPSSLANVGPSQYLSLKKGPPTSAHPSTSLHESSERQYSESDQYLSLKKELHTSSRSPKKHYLSLPREPPGSSVPQYLSLKKGPSPGATFRNQQPDRLYQARRQDDWDRDWSRMQGPDNRKSREDAGRELEVDRDPYYGRDNQMENPTDDQRASQQRRTLSFDRHHRDHYAADYDRDTARGGYDGGRYSEAPSSGRWCDGNPDEPDRFAREAPRESYQKHYDDDYVMEGSPKRGSRSSYHRHSTANGYPADRGYSRSESVDDRRHGDGGWRDDDHYSRTRNSREYSSTHDEVKKQPLPSRGYAVESPKEKVSNVRGYEIQGVKKSGGSPSGRAELTERERGDRGRYDEPYDRRRREYDDREESSPRKEPRYESPRRSRKYNGSPHSSSSRRSGSSRGDHQGRDEYSRRAEEYSRRNERYHDPYYGRN
ncbi:MAG: hypothetical protein SGILL_003598 [Bacillariaceae sp.]